jgi:uncharacterized membrane protein
MAGSLQHALELLLGLPRDFLGRQGEFSVQFNPAWPGQAVVGAAAWNAVLAILCVALVVYVYARDGRGRAIRIFLGCLRGLLLGVILVLLNRPVLTLTRTRVEPSVLAVLVDDSSSMRVPDVGPANAPQGRLAAVEQMFAADGGGLLRGLARTHDVRLYKFDRDAAPIADVRQVAPGSKRVADVGPAVAALGGLKPEADSTQVLPSILTVLQDLQGQRVAGVVLFTDGRDTPARSVGDAIDQLKNYGVKVFPVAVGSDRPPRNIEMQSMDVDDVAFKGDVVNVRARVRATGFEPGHAVEVVLKDKRTGATLSDLDGKPAERTINLPDDKPAEVELQWKPSAVGNVDVVCEAVKQPGEIDDADNSRTAPVSVLDAKVSVLYVDGYPRWEYRYLKNEMIRDKSMEISCLLASADPNFLQEGTKSLPSESRTASGHFPDTLPELLEYDAVVMGDVDPRYFSDQQLQLISDFVSRGGGFYMIAGPRFSPQAYRNTAIEPLLPVTISRVEPTDPTTAITDGFRPVLTKAGGNTSIFRFLADREQNDRYLRDDLPLVYWYCHGITAKPSVGEVLAEHPTDVGPDGRKAPILVAGRFGGRTLFSAIDESWRWRFYTGESTFDTYWVQQLRYLARGRKIGQRRLTFLADQPVYELGQPVRLTLRVVDPSLLKQLPDQIRVEVNDAAGRTVRVETLLRQEAGGTNPNGTPAGLGDVYSGSFTADGAGRFTVSLPPIASGVDMMDVPLSVVLPRMELVDPRVDRVQLSGLASETMGRAISLAEAPTVLPTIPSAAKVLPDISGQPLWAAPLVLALFVLVIGTEWVVRKVYGMV